MLAHTCAHACIAAHMDLYIIVSSTQYTCTYQICGIQLKLPINDGTHTDKHCDMHLHSIPFINLDEHPKSA